MIGGYVVTDTSPIRALHHVGLMGLCQSLYGEVIVPEVVGQELAATCQLCTFNHLPQSSMYASSTSAAAPGLEISASMKGSRIMAVL